MKPSLIALQTLLSLGLIAAPKPDPCLDFQSSDDSLLNGCKYEGAYNSPANIDLSAGWDVYGNISYLYWYVNEDGLDLATTGSYITGVYEPISSQALEVTTVFQESNYTSGFKIGIGSDLHRDHWSVDLEYTYLRESTTASYSTPTAALDIPVYYFTGWVVPFYVSTGDMTGTGADRFNSKWSFNLDWLDLMFKRPYYQGRSLTVTPSAGLRASWIAQSLDISSPTGRSYEYVPYNLLSTTASHSWAIGPRGLVDIHWLIGRGFRFQGNFGGSLLFTQYTQLRHLDNGVSYSDDTSGASMVINNFNCLRPMAEGNLGIGWGRYFAKNEYHCDFSATYDFNYLWNQNMLRYVVNLNSQAYSPDHNGPAYGTGAALYDAYLHGLTLNARLDF